MLQRLLTFSYKTNMRKTQHSKWQSYSKKTFKPLLDFSIELKSHFRNGLL